MESYVNQRPMALPVAVAPLSAALIAAAAPLSVGRVSVAAARPWAPQAHRVEVQAELILAPTSTGTQGTSGFTGKGVDGANKRMDVRGVPPRGRPV
ncbi:hypothetical protein [Micromonospora endophytica]|uniref:Uncharacterized protein n=1 Tax=Micromonospora endophytica TaxID=515350 RepID=A0A2W2CJA6_9ACTN|nr:hypothetical protein [Micromonospora endophytica]PZF97980.1 hypothetical protein C1I93_10255 [Micromonospora endophytica]RIW44662.1 hypothetical protein D3H59_17200 [Micromonospora endophytica]BCJ60405.1 hypothetical protein Jiend_38270 [Micromonospora endophytica]